MNQTSKDILISAFKKLAIEKVMKELILFSSFFALPVVNKLTLILAEKIIDIIITKTELGLFFMYVNFTIETQVKELQDSLKKQRENPSEENEKELISKFNNLVKLNKPN
jgi:hypothetical protein